MLENPLVKKSRILIPFERQLVPYHETVQNISIIPRRIGARGYDIQRPTEDRYPMTLDELKDKMTSLPGGRAAEVLVLDKLSNGAADDLAKAT